MTDPQSPDSETTSKEAVKVAIDKKQQKIVQVDPDRCLSAINPRSLEELEWESLTPKVLSERGVVTTPLLLWKLDPDAPEWETIGEGKFAKLTHEERAKSFITIQGHRRGAVMRHLKASPTMYPADVVTNAQTVPAIVLSGITLDRAEDLAMDDEAKKTLKSWETVRVVLRRYHKDHKRADISVDIPQLLYRSLLGNGEARYTEVSLMADGTERNAKYVKDLRNKMDTYVQTCFLIGQPLEEQLLLHIKKVDDKRPLLKGQDRLLNCKYEDISKLRQLYNKSRDETWAPITKIAVDEMGEPIVEGGNETVRKWLTQKMREFRNPEIRTRGPNMPNSSDRENASSSARSESHKLAAAFFCGLPSEGRQEADEKAYFREQREATRSDLRPEMSELVQALIDAENGERDMAKVKEAYSNVDEVVHQVIDLYEQVTDLQGQVAGLKTEVESLKKKPPFKKGK